MFTMFALIASMTVICLAVIILLKCSSITRAVTRNSLRVIAALLILLSAVTLAVDIPAYIKGGYEEIGNAKVIKLGPVEGFSVEDTGHGYWRFEFDSADEHNMYMCPNPKNTEIVYRSLNEIVKYPLVFTYLPMSNYITEVKVMIQGNEFTSEFHKAFDAESKVMCVVFAAVFIWFVVIVIKRLLLKRKNKYKDMNLG